MDDIEGLLADVSDGVQEALTQYGWTKGQVGAEGTGFCLMGAWNRATGLDAYGTQDGLTHAFRESARKVIGELYPVHGTTSVEGFNDHAMTTEEDVRLVAKHAITGIADLVAAQGSSDDQAGNGQ
jgi:hypothetical protein